MTLRLLCIESLLCTGENRMQWLCEQLSALLLNFKLIAQTNASYISKIFESFAWFLICILFYFILNWTHLSSSALMLLDAHGELKRLMLIWETIKGAHRVTRYITGFKGSMLKINITNEAISQSRPTTLYTFQTSLVSVYLPDFFNSKYLKGGYVKAVQAKPT